MTPANHRWHHASNPEYLDKNFGGVFILWDRLLGTYQDEQTAPRALAYPTHWEALIRS